MSYKLLRVNEVDTKGARQLWHGCGAYLALLTDALGLARDSRGKPESDGSLFPIEGAANYTGRFPS